MGTTRKILSKITGMSTNSMKQVRYRLLWPLSGGPTWKGGRKPQELSLQDCYRFALFVRLKNQDLPMSDAQLAVMNLGSEKFNDVIGFLQEGYRIDRWEVRSALMSLSGTLDHFNLRGRKEFKELLDPLHWRLHFVDNYTQLKSMKNVYFFAALDSGYNPAFTEFDHHESEDNQHNVFGSSRTPYFAIFDGSEFTPFGNTALLKINNRGHEIFHWQKVEEGAVFFNFSKFIGWFEHRHRYYTTQKDEYWEGLESLLKGDTLTKIIGSEPFSDYFNSEYIKKLEYSGKIDLQSLLGGYLEDFMSLASDDYQF